MSIIKSLTLDVGQYNYPQKVFAKQGDINSREIEITLVDKGLVYSIPSGATARIRLTKPDGTIVLSDAIIENEIITVLLTEQMLLKDGTATAEIGIYTAETLLTSQVFYIEVEKSAFDSNAPESSDELSALNAALLEYEQRLADVANILSFTDTINLSGGEA